jgi:hypothetical protein
MEKIFRVNVSVWKPDKICSIDDKMISHNEYDVSGEKIGDFMEELTLLCETYKIEKNIV